MATKTVDIPLGNRTALGLAIDLPGAPLVLARGTQGFVMCGFLDIKSADKFNTAAAVVRGVKTIDDLLRGAVTDVSAAAGKMGVATGMTGRQALEIFL
jgi:uncharacterized protein YunC (DUF1805 family)